MYWFHVSSGHVVYNIVFYTGTDAEKINGSCPGKYTFSLLDEYARRRREVLVVGLSARLPGKFEDIKPAQIQFNAFSYALHA